MISSSEANPVSPEWLDLWANWPDKGVIVLDTETTGLKAGEDQVLSLAVTDTSGGLVYRQLFRPTRVTAWPEAERVNHIRPQDVDSQPTIGDRREEIDRLLGSSTAIVGYNVAFDLGMLAGEGVRIPRVPVIDGQEAYDELHQPIGTYGTRKYAHLWEAAGHYGYRYDPHDALADTRATAFAYHCIRTEARIILGRRQKRTHPTL